MTKFGQTGAINLGKGIPLVGGAIGGAFDGTTTYVIGRAAKGLFIAGEKTSDAEQPQETGFVEGWSAKLFVKDDEQSSELPWSTPKER